MAHLEVEPVTPLIRSIFSYFPGVPILFFVSGFLISKSYENNSVIKEYASNRVIRIYPALIVCTIVTLFSVYLTGYLENKSISVTEFVFWIVGQITVLQFYNPEFMREFGTGVMNGSLWTISVELQFYFMVPLIYYLLNFAKPKNTNRYLLILIFGFMLLYVGKYSLANEYREHLLFSLLSVSFIPWIWMFLVGIFFQKNFTSLHKVLSGKGLYILPLYIAVSYLSSTYFGWHLGNQINPILYTMLVVLIFSLAYSFPTVSHNILKRNDISYGVYIYHIPVINILIYYGYVASLLYVAVALISTVLLAGLSWFVFEKNAMKLKKHSFNPLHTANTAS